MTTPFLIALALSIQASRPFEIPQTFWGEYNERLGDCGTGNNDSRLLISWDRLHFYESVGEIRELIRHPDGSVTIVAEQTGEGQTWFSLYQLRLADDRSSLIVVHPQTGDMEQSESVRLRCPSGRAD